MPVGAGDGHPLSTASRHHPQPLSFAIRSIACFGGCRMLESLPMPMLVLVLAVALGGGGCRRPETDARRAARDGLLLAGISRDPATLDPHLATPGTDTFVLTALFEGLVAADPANPAEVLPAAAERWEHNADFTEWTFFLRRDAEWSDGAPVTALDFVFACHRVLHPGFSAPGSGSLEILRGATEYREDRRGFLLCGSDPKFPVPWPQLTRVNFRGVPENGEADTADTRNFTGLSEEERRQFVRLRGLDRLALPELEWLAADPGRRFEWPADLAVEIRGEVLRRLIARHGEDLWHEAAVGVAAKDDFTLHFRLNQPEPNFPALTCQPPWFPVPRHVVLQFGSMTGRDTPWCEAAHLVGNGPFRITAWRFDDALEVERNPRYWGAHDVPLTGIRFVTIESPGTAVRALLAGQLHLTDKLPRDFVEAARRRAASKLREEAGATPATLPQSGGKVTPDSPRCRLFAPEVKGWATSSPDGPVWKSVGLSG